MQRRPYGKICPPLPLSKSAWSSCPSTASDQVLLVQPYRDKCILITILRMGELEPWIDENFVRSVWFNLGEQVNVKMIRDKFSG